VSAERICAADGCDNTVVRSRRPGRPAIYCSAECRPSRIAAPGPAVAVDVAQDDDDRDDGSRAGRDWIVRLQRGHDSVIVGRDLGRFSALALAGELRRFLAGANGHEGGDSS
jgi:hypothetical protein